MARNYVNTASVATIASSINSSVGTMSVSNYSGYPTAPFWIIVDRDTASSELMEVTAVVGTTLTISRGQGGTVAASHSAGAKVEHVIPAGVASASELHNEAMSNVHGVTGNLVGENQAQTIQNKTYRGAHTHVYSDSLPASPVAGFDVTADSTAARTGFRANNTAADPNQRGYVLTQAGVDRFEVFYDGTLKTNPPGSATRPGIETTTKVKCATLEATGNGTVGGTLGVTGTASLAAGLSVAGASSVSGLTATGAVNANGPATGLSVANNASVNGTLTVGGASTVGSLSSSGAVSASGAVTAGNGVTVSAGNVTLSGSNAKLQFPTGATGAGTAEGQTRYRAESLEVWNGTRWVGTRPIPYFGFTTANPGPQTASPYTLHTLAIADPGWNYRLAVSGSAEWLAGISTRWDLVVRIDSATGANVSEVGIGHDGGGAGVTAQVFAPPATASTVLSGAKTLYLVAVNAYGVNGFDPTGVTTSINALVIPV